MAGHGKVTLEDVLERSAPGVVNTHRIIGCDGAIQEGPGRLAAILGTELLEGVRFLPEVENLFLLGDEIAG